MYDKEGEWEAKKKKTKRKSRGGRVGEEEEEKADREGARSHVIVTPETP